MSFKSRFPLKKSVKYAAMLLSLLGAAPAFAGGWVATETQATPTSGAHDAGLLTKTTPIHVTLALKLRNDDALNQFMADLTNPQSGLYGRFLSVDEFTARYAPTASEAQAVAAYLQQGGFRNVSIAPNRLLVTADGSAEQVSKAFQTELHGFVVDGRTGFANVTPAKVPSALQSSVLSVLGLENLDRVHTMLARSEPDSVGPNAFDPVQFPLIYDAGSVSPASATNVGIITVGSMTQTLSDLRSFESQNSLTQIPVQQVLIGASSTDTSGTTEWDLDSQDIQAMAGGTVQNLVLYVADETTASGLSLSFLTSDFNRVVTDNTVKVINASLGGCEPVSKANGVMAADDQIFQQAVAQGQTFVFASGDGGSNTGCIGHSGLTAQVSYPASSPYVIAVGGTTLTTSTPGGGAYVSESAWVSGGGGISKFEPIPTWQKAFVSGNFRSVPDVSYDADPNTGANIVFDGTLTTVGGTSLSAPLFTGMYARLQTIHNNTLGFPASQIYSLAGLSPSPYHDVTTGNNGSYSAKVGFDQTTGFGSIDISLFVTDF